MCKRSLRILVATALAFFPMQMTVDRQSNVAFAIGQCDSTSHAIAYLYNGGTQVGENFGNLNGTTFTYEDCLSLAQGLAISVSGSACGSYGPGEAYAQVEWHVWWDGQYQGQVNQQYDCGDV